MTDIMNNSDNPHISLYHSNTCGYCVRVRMAAQRLGLDLELRNVGRFGADANTETWRHELLEATGRTRVPVLRIAHPSGEVDWMPESRDIIRYLEANYA